MTDASLATVACPDCPLCGGVAFRPLPFAYHWGGAVLPGRECVACRLRGLALQPAPHEFARLYAHGYFAGGDVRCGHVGDYFADRAALLADGDALARRFEALAAGEAGAGAGRLLEVGCASGAVLEAAAKRGWTVQGVEYSADAAAEAARHGVPVAVGGLPEAQLADAAFDVAFLGDVLEHVPDPVVVLHEVARVLAPGGLLVLRGPLTTHSLGRALAMFVLGSLGRTARLVEPPYHLWEFTPRTLRALVEAAGLEVRVLDQAKTPPSLHKRRSAVGLAIAALDAFNVAWTVVTGTRGDRCWLVARKPRPGEPRRRPADEAWLAPREGV